MEIVCIKAQTIRKATEESEQKKVQYKVLGESRCKTKVPRGLRRASVRKFPFSLWALHFFLRNMEAQASSEF